MGYFFRTLITVMPAHTPQDFKFNTFDENKVEYLSDGDFDRHFGYLVDEGHFDESTLLKDCYFKPLTDEAQVLAFKELMEADEKTYPLSAFDRKRRSSKETDPLNWRVYDYVGAFENPDDIQPMGVMLLSRWVYMYDPEDWYDEDGLAELPEVLDPALEDVHCVIKVEAVYVREAYRRRGVGSYLARFCADLVTDDMENLNKLQTKERPLEIEVAADWDTPGGEHVSTNFYRVLEFRADPDEFEAIKLIFSMSP